MYLESTGFDGGIIGREQGFTLVEVLIAMLIVGAGLVPVLALFLTSSRIVEKGGLILQATIVAQNIIDRAKSDDFLWNNVPVSIDIPNPKYPIFAIPKSFADKYQASATLIIEHAPGHTVIGTGQAEENLVQISVLIYWIENRQPRNHRLVTYRANTNSFNIKTSTRL